MSEKLDAGGRGSAATGNDRLKLFEPPGTGASIQVLSARDRQRSPNTRPKSEGTTPLVSEVKCRSINREGAPDLRSHCPVCGHPYQPGEGVLALACLSFAPSVVPSSPVGAGYDPGSKMILGHHTCVQPRLLTLVAGFQPEGRFVRAARDFAAAESVVAEHHHDEP